MGDFRFCPLCGERLEPLAAGPDAGRPACASGHFVHYDNPAVTVMAFIERDGAYLVLKRAEEPLAGHWDMPGGFVEAGESPADAIVREVREETGLEVEAERLLGAYTSEYGETGRHTVDLAYVCRVSGGDWSLAGDEKSDAAWLALGDFPQLAFAGERQALNDLRGG